MSNGNPLLLLGLVQLLVDSNKSFLPCIVFKAFGIVLVVSTGISIPLPGKTESGKCIIEYPRKINCNYKARNKKITPAEMEGSTFTVSNLGMFGI